MSANELTYKGSYLRPFPFGYTGKSSFENMPKHIQVGSNYIWDELKLKYYNAEVDDKGNYLFDTVFQKTYLWEWQLGEWPVDHLAIYFDQDGNVSHLEEFLIYFEMP